MHKTFLVLMTFAIISGLVIMLLFFIVPDLWIASLSDKNLLKRMMNNDFFIGIYVMIALSLTGLIGLGTIYLMCLCLGA